MRVTKKMHQKIVKLKGETICPETGRVRKS